MSNIWFSEDGTEINKKEDFAGLWFNAGGETPESIERTRQFGIASDRLFAEHHRRGLGTGDSLTLSSDGQDFIQSSSDGEVLTPIEGDEEDLGLLRRDMTAPSYLVDDNGNPYGSAIYDDNGNTYDTSERTSPNISSRFGNKSYEDIKQGKPNFSQMISNARAKGKFGGASDSDILKQMNEGWDKLNPPNGGPVDRKIKCGNCGGGKGVCILGGCFSGKKLTWWL